MMVVRLFSCWVSPQRWRWNKDLASTFSLPPAAIAFPALLTVLTLRGLSSEGGLSVAPRIRQEAWRPWRDGGCPAGTVNAPTDRANERGRYARARTHSSSGIWAPVPRRDSSRSCLIVARNAGGKRAWDAGVQTSADRSRRRVGLSAPARPAMSQGVRQLASAETGLAPKCMSRAQSCTDPASQAKWNSVQLWHSLSVCCSARLPRWAAIW
mmetsp:Transcript_13490/g.24090  ORF Transcript_13490/g.24090 Transcript_13490/m.24090 type:complete len:211 (+) Transcript_13490:988-1620(+)